MKLTLEKVGLKGYKTSSEKKHMEVNERGIWMGTRSLKEVMWNFIYMTTSHRGMAAILGSEKARRTWPWIFATLTAGTLYIRQSHQRVTAR